MRSSHPISPRSSCRYCSAPPRCSRAIGQSPYWAHFHARAAATPNSQEGGILPSFRTRTLIHAQLPMLAADRCSHLSSRCSLYTKLASASRGAVMQHACIMHAAVASLITPLTRRTPPRRRARPWPHRSYPSAHLPTSTAPSAASASARTCPSPPPPAPRTPAPTAHALSPHPHRRAAPP